MNDVKKLSQENEHWHNRTNTPPVVDEIDQKIIDLLIENGRYSGVYIADKLGISKSLISKRLARLLKDEVIQIRAQLNPAKVGYELSSFIFRPLSTELAATARICHRNFYITIMAPACSKINKSWLCISYIIRSLTTSLQESRVTHEKRL